jgi:hypothetical protein
MLSSDLASTFETERPSFASSEGKPRCLIVDVRDIVDVCDLKQQAATPVGANVGESVRLFDWRATSLSYQLLQELFEHPLLLRDIGVGGRTTGLWSCNSSWS